MARVGGVHGRQVGAVLIAKLDRCTRSVADLAAGRLTSFSEHATVGCSGIKRMRMNRHDDSQRSGRLVTQPVRPTQPPSNSLYEKQLTAPAGRPADRPLRDPAHAVAFTAAVAIGGAGSVHRRTGMRAARALPGDRNRPGSPYATDCRVDPPQALPAIQTRCFADHHPVWRCEARTQTRPYSASIAEIHRKWGCKMILKEPHARAA